MQHRFCSTRIAIFAALLLACGFAHPPTKARAEDQPQAAQGVKHRVTGLFSPDRVDDLRAVVDTLPGLKLESIDYDNAEAVFVYEPKLFNNGNPEQVVERFNSLLRGASRGTFGIKPLCTLPKEKLEFIEIPAAALDCKGCAYGAYRGVFELPGVEWATVSFKHGKVTAWIDPAVAKRADLEEALKKRGVELTGK